MPGIFSQTIHSLLNGSFICEISDPEAFLFLEDAAEREEANRWFARMDRRIATTAGGAAYYLTAVTAGDLTTSAVKEALKAVNNDLHPLVRFMDLVLSAGQDEEVMAPGHVIRLAEIADRIDRSESLREELKQLADLMNVKGDMSDRKRLEFVANKLRDAGYLHCANRDRDIYQVTGKIEWFQEALSYIVETNAELEREVDQARRGNAQGVLL